MSTIAEIEEAVEALPLQQQRELLNHLSVKLAQAGRQASGAEGLRRGGRGFPVVSGRVRFAAEDVARIEAEA